MAAKMFLLLQWLSGSRSSPSGAPALRLRPFDAVRDPSSLKHLKQTASPSDLTRIHTALMHVPRSRCRNGKCRSNFLDAWIQDGRDLRRSDMQTDNPAVRERTGYALFDDSQVLVDANAEIFGGNAPARADFPKMDLVAVIAKILP